MSSFTTPLEIREEGDGTFTLLSDFHYYLDHPDGEKVRIPAGYSTDFATTKMFSWLFPPYHPDYGKAAVLHDYLLTHGTVTRPDGFTWNMTRREADREFKRAMKVLGTPRWKRFLMYNGVRLWSRFKD